MAEKSNALFPVSSLRFALSLGSFNGNSDKQGYDASFQEISGITTEIPVEEIQEGGENRFVHRVPQPLKYSNLVLKRGVVTSSSELSKWCQSTINSGFATHVELKDVVVRLLSDQNETILDWNFLNAYPVKWEYSALDATKNQIFVQTIELCFQRFEENIEDWRKAVNTASNLF